jgi:hypothetical protein
MNLSVVIKSLAMADLLDRDTIAAHVRPSGAEVA